MTTHNAVWSCTQCSPDSVYDGRWRAAKLRKAKKAKYISKRRKQIRCACSYFCYCFRCRCVRFDGVFGLKSCVAYTNNAVIHDLPHYRFDCEREKNCYGACDYCATVWSIDKLPAVKWFWQQIFEAFFRIRILWQQWWANFYSLTAIFFLISALKTTFHWN